MEVRFFLMLFSPERRVRLPQKKPLKPELTKKILLRELFRKISVLPEPLKNSEKKSLKKVPGNLTRGWLVKKKLMVSINARPLFKTF